MEGSSYYPSDSKLTFKILLDKNKTVSINRKNLQALATKIFKAKLDISPEILKKKLFSFHKFFINKKFCVLWQRKLFLAGTVDVELGSRQFQK